MVPLAVCSQTQDLATALGRSHIVHGGCACILAGGRSLSIGRNRRLPASFVAVRRLRRLTDPSARPSSPFDVQFIAQMERILAPRAALRPGLSGCLFW
jgi:hypothetical protein